MARFPSVLCVALATLAASGTASAQTLATGAPSTTFTVTSVASGLGQLTDFKFLPDGRIVSTTKDGLVKVRTTAGTVVDAGSFPVDTASEKGLLGVEVHPSFTTNKTLFFYYSRSSSAPTDPGTDLDRHRVVTITLTDANKLDMTTEKVILRNLHGPANHDGGGLSIGKDGKLYVGVGDTGCNCSCAPGANTTNWYATCLANGNGKVLRINLDGTIPTDNPLVGKMVSLAGSTCGSTTEVCGKTAALSGPSASPRTEIWAWGFRNPFRVWADPVTGLLWVGDVGEITWEEIDVVSGNHHYGWPRREGAAGQPASWCQSVTPNTGDCVDPVYACPRSDCSTIVGGRIMDSCTWPDTFKGLYFFGDYSSNKIWTLKPNAGRDGVVAGSRADFADINAPVSFQAGPEGALYVGTLGGKLAKFDVKTPVTCSMDAGVDSGPGDTGSATDSSTASDTSTSDDSAVADTGASTTDTGALDDSTVGGDSGATSDAGSSDSGGCGCSTPGGAARHALMPIMTLAIGLFLRRRRR